MSYRSYVPWSKGNSGSTYSSTGGSYLGIPKTSDTPAAKGTDLKSNTGYTSGRYGGTTGSGSGTTPTGSTYRGTTSSTGTSNYRPYSSTDRSTTPSKYGSSTLTTSYQSNKDKEKEKDSKDSKENERPSIREKYNMGPALPSPTTTTTTTSTLTKDAREKEKPSIRDKYSLNSASKDDRQSLIDKYSSGTYPGRSSETGRTYGSSGSLAKEDAGSSYRSRISDKSPARNADTSRSYGSSGSLVKEDTASSYSKSSLNRTKSPEPDKNSSYSSLSPYRLYSRSSSTYSRSNSKDTDTSSSTATPATTPVTTPTSLRFGSSRFGGSLPRSPVSEKSPSISCVSPTPTDTPRRPWSPRNRADEVKDTTLTTIATTVPETTKVKEAPAKKIEVEAKKVETVIVAVVTRGTSPTPPSSSSFLRTRRADLARVIEKNISRPVVRPEMLDKEIQSDRGDDTARLSRYGATSRASVAPWSSYLDRYSSAGSTYSPVSKYASRLGGYVSTRGDRDATVTRSTPSEPTSSAADVSKSKATIESSEKNEPKPPTTAKEEGKESDKRIEKVVSGLLLEKEKEVTNTLKKSDSLTTNTNVSNVGGVKKVASEPKVLERLKKSPSIVKLAEALNAGKYTGLKKDEAGLNGTKTSKLDEINTEQKVECNTKVNDSSLNKISKLPGEPNVTETSSKSPSNSKEVGLNRKSTIQDGVSADQTVSASAKLNESRLNKSPKPPGQPKVMETVLKASSISKEGEVGLNTTQSTKQDRVNIEQKVSGNSILNESSLNKLPKSPVESKVTEVLPKTPSVSKECDVSLNRIKSPKVTEGNTEQNVAGSSKLSESSLNKISTSPDEPKVTETLTKSRSISKESELATGKQMSGNLQASKESSELASPPISAALDKVPSIKKSPSKVKIGENINISKKSLSAAKVEESNITGTLQNVSNVLESSKDTSSNMLKETSKTTPKEVKPKLEESLPKRNESTAAKVDSTDSGKLNGSKLINKRESPTASELENVKLKSSSQSLSSEGEQVKTPPTSPSLSTTSSVVKLGSPAGSRKFLPPHVPKTDGHSSLKTSPIQNSLNKTVSNKDFRKSTLNMDVAPTEAEELQRLQEKQRLAGKREIKTKRSTSASSDKSEGSEATEASESTDVRGNSVPLPIADSKTSSIQPSKSLSNSKIPPSSPVLRTKTFKVPSPKRASPARSSKSPLNRKSESSSDETSSSESSCTSSSEEDEEETPSRSDAVNLRRRSSKSPPAADNRKSTISVTSLVAASSADESSIADKPPRPPSSPKPAPKEEAKSFLMRALAPVTNLFKSRPQTPESLGSSSENISESLQRTGSTQSLSKSLASDKEEDSYKLARALKKKIKIQRVESGERAWWMGSNSNIPEGIQRIQSSKSISQLSVDSEKDISKRSEVSDSCERSEKSEKSEKSGKSEKSEKSNKSGKSEKSEKSEKHKRINLIKRVESGDRAWWLDSNANIPEGIERNASSASLNKKLVDSDKESKTSDDSYKPKKYRIKHIESGERAWWLERSSSIPENIQKISSGHSIPEIKEPSPQPEDAQRKFPIRRQESGEKAWWLCSNANVPEGVLKLSPTLPNVNEMARKEGEKSSESSEEDSEESGSSESEEEKKKETQGLPKFPLDLQLPHPPPPSKSHKHKPEEVSGRTSPYDNVLSKTPVKIKKKRPKNQPLFISNHTNIDDILGTAATLVNPVRRLSGLHDQSDDESGDEEEECKEVDPRQVRIHDSTAKKPTIQHIRDASDGTKRKQSADKLDDAALQLYKDGDYGSYLDLEASINEQQEEFEGFQTNRKNSIVLRTQLSVRVHTIIEKLLNSEGRELRRALFSLKQIFQEDKDLVHEFVQNDGLACLIKVGSEADQNYQNYILRALGQVMLYVDGMNGVMEHNRTVQWLYALIASKFRLVVKTALKLLLVFVEYVETNCLLLIRAVHAVDTAQGCLPWSNIMKLIKDYDAADTELLIYATTLVNKTFNGVPDQDTYYDQVDALEEQGVEGAIQRYMSKQGTDLDLLRQFQIYEAVLHHEDGEEKGTPLRQLDESIRKTLRNRKSLTESLTTERRKSRRHSTGTAPLSASLNHSRLNHSNSVQDDEESGSSSSRSSPGPGELPHLNGSYKDKQSGDAGVTPALRRRRERAERQRSFIREQQETAANLRASLGLPQDGADDDNEKLALRINGSCDSNKLSRASSRKDLTPLMNAANKLDSADNESKSLDSNGLVKKPWAMSMMYDKGEDPDDGNNELDDKEDTQERKVLLQLKRENTVKDLTQKLASQNILHSPVEEKMNRIGDMSGLISKAKEGLAKSKSKADILKSSSGDVPKLVEIKKSETELHWEELVSSMKRPLEVCDLDFTDLKSDDEVDILSPIHVSNGIPPPPPPAPMPPGMPPKDAPPPPPPNRLGNFIPPCPTTPTSFGVNLRHQRNATTTSPEKTPTSPTLKKTKKTVKLFWKEVRDDPIIVAKLQKAGMIWDELLPVLIDTQKLEHLFESRAKDLITKKQQELNKNKEIIVLDHKRSNAINIGMTKLPPPRSIKTAILKMDATIMNREGIEKLLTMLPTEEERSKIQEAQMANPETPLGSAEQFLLTLTSISELPARLKLWAFKLDYENSEKEIAEPLMDLKQGIETLKINKTFRGILSTLLSIGIFLNGNEVKGFQIEYLAKVPEVKDTVHKHSLLHHLCHMVMEKFPEATDLYSEIGAVTRASKVDFDELSANIVKMEQECKASWDHLKLIAKHDGSTMMKVKMSDFLADCAERIIVLGIVHRRVMNRFHLFLLWLGIPLHRVQDMKPNEFCRIVSEFALEYRTTRERVLQQLEKKANHRERNKTRGKMITEVGKFRTKEDRADAELRQLLGSDLSDAESVAHGTLPWRRQRKDLRTVLGPLARDEPINGNLTDGDDEILESLVKTATKAAGTRTTPRERKRTRQADRKSLKRSRTRENNVQGEGSASP